MANARLILTVMSCGLLTSLASAGECHFTESAAAAGIQVTHSAAAFSHADYTAGGAAGDFNNDGFQDLFVISGTAAIRDHLFINQGDGTFVDEGAAWGLALHKGKGASVGDFNKDGWLDIYQTSAGVTMAQPGHHKLWRNNGNGTFTNIAASAGVAFTTTTTEGGFGSCFGDYDLDGDLDLFVAGFAAGSSQGSRLFRNNGDETFTNVTTSIGFFTGSPLMSAFAPRFLDMDGDWYPEMLLVADFGTSRYFRNNGNGTFTDITGSTSTSAEENGMGQTVGDFNNDGRIDWYVTSIYYPSLGWTGNKYYRNQDDHHFTQHAAVLDVDDGGYGWGALAIDFNHDTRIDIAETNGDSGGFGDEFLNEQAYLWMQDADLGFTEMAIPSGLTHYGKGRGMVNLDVENDGDQDVVIFSFNEPLMFFVNEVTGTGINWLRVFLDTSKAPGLAPNGHNAIVRATIGSLSLMRVITSGDNFLSHSELSAHFGLGAATIVDELKVEWPDGTTTVLNDVAVNQTITIAPGDDKGNPADLDGDGDVDGFDLALLLGDWTGAASYKPCPPHAAADLNADCKINGFDLALLLGAWGGGR